MIRSFIIALVVFFLLFFAKAPVELAIGIAATVFVISIPFSVIFGWAERSARRADERNEALEDIARGVRMSGRFRSDRPNTVSGPRTIVKDDRAVIIDNRQVNIYNGSGDAAEGASYGTEERKRRRVGPC